MVTELEQATALVDAVEVRLNTALQHVGRTSQAVLAKAFRGELLALADSGS